MSVNPLSISHVTELIDEKSRTKYVKYWEKFVEAKEISEDKPPTDDIILEFLKDCKEGKDGAKGYAPTTLWTVFSCLNKFCRHLYKMNLNVSLKIF